MSGLSRKTRGADNDCNRKIDDVDIDATIKFLPILAGTVNKEPGTPNGSLLGVHDVEIDGEPMITLILFHQDYPQGLCAILDKSKFDLLNAKLCQSDMARMPGA